MKTIAIAVVAIVLAIAFPFLTIPIIIGLVAGTLLFVLPSFFAFILLFPVLLLLGNASLLIAISVMLVLSIQKYAQKRIEAFFSAKEKEVSTEKTEEKSTIIVI